MTILLFKLQIINCDFKQKCIFSLQKLFKSLRYFANTVDVEELMQSQGETTLVK